MPGRSCLYRQQNIEKRKVMSVRERSELCAKDDLRAAGVDDVELKASADSAGGRMTRDRKSTRLNSSHSGESRMPSSA